MMFNISILFLIKHNSYLPFFLRVKDKNSGLTQQHFHHQCTHLAPATKKLVADTYMALMYAVRVDGWMDFFILSCLGKGGRGSKERG